MSVQLSLDAAANTKYTIQIFANPTASASGYGDGQILVDTIHVTTDMNGDYSNVITESVPQSPNLVGYYLSATATDPAGDTSEFGKDCQVSS